MKGFNERKAAHVAAFFASKQGGTISVIKLVKLIYLADREFLNRYDAPILHDWFVSMRHGPVNSVTYDLISGQAETSVWDDYLRDASDHMIECVQRRTTADDLDELSEAEVEVLEDVWRTFGRMGRWDLRDYTHKHCPEWKDPGMSSSPISYEEVLKALGKGNSAHGIAARIEAERSLIRRTGQQV